jgi:hypothetical protein
VVKRILNFQSQIGQNSGCHKYLFGSQLSQLFDAPLNGSIRLANCELQQLNTRPAVEISISGQIAPSCINQVFGKCSPWPPQKLCIQKMSPTNSAFFLLLIRPDWRYGLVAMDFKVRFLFQTDYGQTGYAGAWSGFWATRWVKLASLWIQILKVTNSAFRHLLRHIFSKPQQRLRPFKHCSRAEFGSLLKIWIGRGLEGLPRVQTA